MGATQQLRDERTNSPPSPEAAENRFCYRIGSCLILMEAEILAEILTSHSIYPLPFAPDWCLGLTSLRGDIYPIVDMHRVLLGQSSDGRSQLLLVKHPDFSPVILTCDGYPQQLKLPTDLPPEQTDAKLPGWISHAQHHEGQLLLAANHGRLLRYLQPMSNKRT